MGSNNGHQFSHPKMKNPIQLVVVVVIFAISLALNMLVLERGGSFANEVLLYGVYARFSLSGELTLLAGFFGTVGFLLAFALYRLTLPAFTARKQLTMVSMYMNGIALGAILMMAAFPSVHFR